MAGSIQGSFVLYKLRNGKNSYTELSRDKQLQQTVALDGDGKVTAIAPDWTQASNQPTITLGIGEGLTATDLQWLYNGTPIVFPSTKFSLSANGMSLKITDNLASATNLFTDTIGVTGTLLDASGYYAGSIDKSIEIPINKASANGYMVLINTIGGTSISASSPKTTLEGVLQQGASVVDGFTNFKWYSGLDNTVIGTGKTLEVTRDMVTGYQFFVCKAYSIGNVELDAESITIYDKSDDYLIWVTAVSNKETINIDKTYRVPADATDVTLTPHISVNGTELTGKTWTLNKLHYSSTKLIAEISDNNDATTDTDVEDNYNTSTSGSIVIKDKDYTSIVGSEKLYGEVLIIGRVNV